MKNVGVWLVQPATALRATLKKQSGTLPKTVLYIAETSKSPSIEEQISFCAGNDDLIIEGGKTSILKLPARLIKEGKAFAKGDTLKIYDLTCLPINTTSLIRFFMELVNDGVTVRFCAMDLEVRPEPNSDVHRLMTALDVHWRAVHGMKTHPSDAKTGRKALLSEDQLPTIRQQLNIPGATVAKVAKALGVGRTTLFDFLQRHKENANAEV